MNALMNDPLNFYYRHILKKECYKKSNIGHELLMGSCSYPIFKSHLSHLPIFRAPNLTYLPVGGKSSHLFYRFGRSRRRRKGRRPTKFSNMPLTFSSSRPLLLILKLDENVIDSTYSNP